ncbi:MAG: hypothetical protein PVG45_12965 [Gammaproteobacteria bacterium]|jgi:hypothetical protein
MNILYQSRSLALFTFVVILSASCSDNDVEYTGILDHRPEGKDGMWVIEGKSFSVTADVELDEEDGPLQPGSCVEIEMEEGDVKEIESAKMEKCQPQQQ